MVKANLRIKYYEDKDGLKSSDADPGFGWSQMVSCDFARYGTKLDEIKNFIREISRQNCIVYLKETEISQNFVNICFAQ